jgi:3-methyladenine DNA glycosylase AlkC
MSHPLANRKPARTMKEVPADVLEAINRGQIETLNLVEFLSVDHTAIGPYVLQQAGFEKEAAALAGHMTAAGPLKAMDATRTAARALYNAGAATGRLEEIRQFMAGHGSDIIRHYAAYITGQLENRRMEDIFGLIRPFAADQNPGTREIAFMAVRHHIIARPQEAVEILTPWTAAADANVRRFASESTRPRGVWMAHAPAFRKNPSLGLPILTPLNADPSRYVQNSVANWLNDASKDHPDFVRDVCSEWLAARPGEKATVYIANRALRTLRKKSG